MSESESEKEKLLDKIDSPADIKGLSLGSTAGFGRGNPLENH
jgi:hypothetical protein